MLVDVIDHNNWNVPARCFYAKPKRLFQTVIERWDSIHIIGLSI